MNKIFTIENIIAMITPREDADSIAEGKLGKPMYWLTSCPGTRDLPDNRQVMQVVLSVAEGEEPFPGCTANLLQFLKDTRDATVLGALSDAGRRVIDISFPSGKSTHSEAA